MPDLMDYEVMIATDKVLIQSPCPDSELPLVWEWLNHFAKETLDEQSPQSMESFLERERATRSTGGKTFAIMMDDKLIGAVWCEAIGNGMAIGHLVFDPGHTISTREKVRASRCALESMFLSFRKIIWTFFSDNRAFRVFLKRLGAIEEGCFRKSLMRKGEWVDQAFMASFPEGSL
jgi:hypothetical protein